MDKPTEPAAGTGSSTIYLDKVIYLQNFYTKSTLEYKMRVEYIPASRSLNILRVVEKAHSEGTFP